jgi:axial budding pattern protein 2
MVLYGSDQEGLSAGKPLPFDIVIARDELSQAAPPPIVNITEGAPFNISLGRLDFTGIRVNEQPVDTTDITAVSVDTSSCNWLAFDSGSRMLSGNPPSDPGSKYTFPMTLGAVGQILETTLSVAIVGSYFASPSCPPLTIGDDRKVNFNLTPYFSDAFSDRNDDVILSAAFPGNYMSFDNASATLTGTVPETSASTILVDFTAYSRMFHSTSHTTLTIMLPSASQTKNKGSTHPTNLSAAVHKKLVLALGIVFGVIGVVCALGAFFALFRRCARVDDTVRADQEAWSDSDKRWYGIVDEEKGYGSSMPRPAMDIQNPFGAGAQLVTPVRGAQDYGALGLGLRRVAERSGSDPVSNVSPGSSQSPGVMRKGEFMTRIRQTVRNVSEKYGSRRQTSANRPVIGKPTLIVPDGLPYDVQGSPSDPFDDANNIRSYPGSAVMTNSPSTSTGEHSIPRRRADFAPPRSPPVVHFQDGLVRQLSSGSLSSDEEAVVQVASKATSIRSGMSHHQSTGSAGPRPRLVPFTSATRVPVPRVPSLSVETPSGSPSRRVTSQRAMVLKEASDGVNRSPTADELSMGLHYVRSLGGDYPEDPSTPSVSTNVRSSFSSLESSHHGHAAAGIMRTLIRTGEKFKFRVPVSLYDAASYKKVRKLEAKLMSGKPLPKFLHVDLNGNKHAGAVEFYGAPAARDLGEFNVGVYTADDGACVGRVVVEVVAASR